LSLLLLSDCLDLSIVVFTSLIVESFEFVVSFDIFFLSISFLDSGTEVTLLSISTVADELFLIVEEVVVLVVLVSFVIVNEVEF